MSSASPAPRPGRGPERPVVLVPGPRPSWESFSAMAFRGLVGLLVLLVIVLGVLFESWQVALTTAKFALVVLLLLAGWLYGLWFVRRRRELTRRDETE
ncbi:MAG: hypothetical protein H0T85_03810, partial [Geodermatophilaceae bacterium]|nr:hypothetical protein [Geodermatophilaceae bacterium]